MHTTVDVMGPSLLLYIVLQRALQIYSWIVIASVVMSWLLNFNVVNYHNNFVRMGVRFVDAVTEPVFRLVRRVLPPIGGLDFSPLVVLGVIWVLQAFVVPQLTILLTNIIG